MIVIEMNPRVSRSSALASKATGFPIAKIAAKLAVGYTLDEIRNDITRETPAQLRADDRLRRHEGAALRVREVPAAPTRRSTTQMKSVGEVMAIGRTFKEALQKALRSLEIGHAAASSRRRCPRRRARARAADADRRAAARAGSGRSARRCGAARTRRGGARAHGDRPVVPRATCAEIVDARGGAARRCRQRARDAALRPAKQHGLLRPPARRALGARARTTFARCAHRARASCRSTSASTPAPPSSRRTRRTSTRPTRTSTRRAPTDARRRS